MTRTTARLSKRRHLPAALAAAALLLTGCREAAQVSAPEYCRYVEMGPLCSHFDPADVPYTVALGLRPLDSIHPGDRPLVRAFVARLPSAPASIRVLAPVGPAPAGRRGFDASLPQAFGRHGNPRLLILALGRAGGRVDLVSLILVENRIAAAQGLAAGLNGAALRGVAANGRFDQGFALADRPGSLGDLYRLQRRGPQGSDELAASLRWTRIAAGSEERKRDFFRGIVNTGSCAGGSVPLLLAPVPPAWIDEYVRTCPFHPDRWPGASDPTPPRGNAV